MCYLANLQDHKDAQGAAADYCAEVLLALGTALLVVVLLLGNLRKHLEALLDLARLVRHESGVLVTRT